MNGSVPKGKLKARLLSYLREVENSGEELVVTDRGVPTVRIVPYRAKEEVERLFAAERGRVVYHDDLDESTLDEWEDA